MSETIGTLNLKIAQLERRLQFLSQRTMLSSAYPEHQQHLLQEFCQAQAELDNLFQYRDILFQDGNYRNGGIFNEGCQGRNSIYAVN